MKTPIYSVCVFLAAALGWPAVQGTRPLVGRDSEVERLEALLDGLEADAPALLAQVSGEPGIGKSRLLAEVSERADDRGWLTLTGRAAEFEADLPFGVVVDALDDYLGSLGTDLTDELGDDALAELSSAFPALGHSGAPADRPQLHRAVRLLLERLAARQPLVIILDDVHWADPASVELLEYLLSRPPVGRLLLCVGLRPAAGSERLAPALGRAARDQGLEPFELGPLTAAQARTLLDGQVEGAAVEELLADSGGNPFYLLQLARSAGATPRAAAVGVRRADVPPSVTAALEEELRALRPADRLLLDAAAVSGDPVEADLAAAVAEVDEGPALEALDSLVSLDLLRATDVPRRFRFRHPIVRRAVYESSTAAWRAAAHGRAAHALGRRGVPAGMRAHHVERSAAQGDPEAVALLAKAAGAALHSAPAAAARWYESALAIAPSEQRLELLIGRGRALGAAGRLPEAREVLEEVLRELPDDAFALTAGVVAAAAQIEYLLGRQGKARTLLAQTLSSLPDTRSREGVMLKLALSSDLFFSGDFAGMRGWAEEAAGDARELDDPGLEAAAIARLGGADYMVGRTPQAVELCEKASRLYGTIGDHETLAHLDSLAWFGWTEGFLERFESADAHLGRALSVAREHGHEHLVPLIRAGMAYAALSRGRLAEGRVQLEGATEGARLHRNDQFLAWTLALASWAAQLRGETQAAVDLGAEAVEVAAGRRDVVTVLAHAWHAEALLETGDSRRARDALLGAAAGAELPLIERPYKPRWYEMLVRAELAGGDVDAAEEWARRGEAAEAGMGLGVREGDSLRGRAAVCLARGRAGEAAGVAREAMAASSGAGAALDAERARTLLGRALMADGDADQGERELRQAATALEALGARGLHGHALTELGQDDEGDHALSTLSRREREVAELVSGGQSNRDVATVLVISERTVERHMENIFRKLDVRSRAAVAAAVVAAPY